MEELGARLVRVLTALAGPAQDPVADIDVLLGADEAHRILVGWNDTRVPVEPELLLDGYRRAPAASRIASRSRMRAPSSPTREFDDAGQHSRPPADRAGCWPGVAGGLAIRRSLEHVVAMYAIMTAGGA